MFCEKCEELPNGEMPTWKTKKGTGWEKINLVYENVNCDEKNVTGTGVVSC